MKLTVKTLKGTHFEIRAQHNDTIMPVKKNIEEIQGKDSYPWGQQLLLHNDKVLKDESTLDENQVSEHGFLVVMLNKSKASSSGWGRKEGTPTTPSDGAAMKLTVKTLKGTHFEIRAQHNDTRFLVGILFGSFLAFRSMPGCSDGELPAGGMWL